MKKSIVALAAALSLAVIFAGCGNSEEEPNEWDILLEQLQTTHLNTGTPENADSPDESSESVTYRSVTGSVISFTDTDITVKADNKEHKFLLGENTQILGGDPLSAEAVTITYIEAEENEKNITADIITVLSVNDSSYVSETESAALPADSSYSSEVSDTGEITEASETDRDTSDYTDTVNTVDSTDVPLEVSDENTSDISETTPQHDESSKETEETTE